MTIVSPTTNCLSNIVPVPVTTFESAVVTAVPFINVELVEKAERFFIVNALAVASAVSDALVANTEAVLDQKLLETI